MDNTVTYINIAAAALLTEFLLAIIMLIGSLILLGGNRSPDRPIELNRNASSLPFWILVTALITLGGLVFSGEFTLIWKPLFGGNVSPPTVNTSSAIHGMFIANIICVSILVKLTGGSYSSPFSPIYFILPALAIFLRESYGWITLYVFMVSILFTIQLDSTSIYSDRNSSIGVARKAYWFISIACLVLTTVIAYVTRPI